MLIQDGSESSELLGAYKLIGRVLEGCEDFQPTSAAWNAIDADPISNELSEENALQFVTVALEDPIAFEKLRAVIWDKLRKGMPLPGAYSVAASYMVIGLPHQKLDKRVERNSGRNDLISWSVFYLWDRFKVKPTRGPDKQDDPDSPASGCAIVSDILNKNAGLNLKESAVQKIWRRSAAHEKWTELKKLRPLTTGAM